MRYLIMNALFSLPISRTVYLFLPENEQVVERAIYYVYHLLSTVSVMMEKARLSLDSIKTRNMGADGEEGKTPPEGKRKSDGNASLGVETAEDLSSSSSSNK